LDFILVLYFIDAIFTILLSIGEDANPELLQWMEIEDEDDSS
jgi:hypothetical protein